MKTFLLPVIFIFIAFAAGAQNYTDPQNMKVTTSQDAHYPNGDQALFNYVYNHINYSPEAMKAKPKGEVTLSFDVETDSTLTGFSQISKVGYGVDEEIIRILKTMKFAPSIQNGFVAKMNLMLTFPIEL